MKYYRFFRLLLRIIHLLIEIRDELRGNNNQVFEPKKEVDLKDLIDQTDVKSILKISDSTLFRIKRQQIISPVRIGKRDYYSRAAIEALVRHFQK